MDRHKFRVFNKKRGVYTEERNMAIDMNGDLYDCKHGLSPVNQDIHIVEFCTGQRDLEDNLVYDGHILSVKLNDQETLAKPVFWSKDCWYWYNYTLDYILHEATIIGTINENPELIDKEV